MSRRLRAFQILLLAAAIVAGGCSRQTPARSSYRMGERMQVGSLVYNVLEAQWKTQLGDLFQARIPQNRFLLLRLTATNSGGKEVSMPLLNLEDTGSNSYPEVQDGTGVPGWLGLLRTIQPAQTEEGWIVFDVPTNSYSLRVSDGGDPGSEQTLLIDIPLDLDSLRDTVPEKAP